VPGEANSVRVVIDDASFEFSGLEVDELNGHIDELSDTLAALRSDGTPAWQPPQFAQTPCFEDRELYSYLPDVADPEIMRRFFSLVDKCPEWDAGYPQGDLVMLSGRAAQSVSYAVTAAALGHCVACLVFPVIGRRGFQNVGSAQGARDVFFFADARDLAKFWRWLFSFENIPESDFFDRCGAAFPRLVFHSALTFRRFSKTYQELRDTVVRHLGALNDEFLDRHRMAVAAGRLSDVEAYFGSLGIGGVSAESVKTRGDSAALRERDVEFDGRTVRCEWHTKIRPNVDRIHFAFGDELGDLLLIGIFVDHLSV
jgi:hypothetical protein